MLMGFVWWDYDPEAMPFVETWLDKCAVAATGLDAGFRDFYEYWAAEEGFVPGKNFWCKVAVENGIPFAAIALCLQERRLTVMELLVAPQMRGQGKGTELLAQLLGSKDIPGTSVESWEAVIFPDNAPSQRAFEKAGFICQCRHKDENGESLRYVFPADPADLPGIPY